MAERMPSDIMDDSTHWMGELGRAMSEWKGSPAQVNDSAKFMNALIDKRINDILPHLLSETLTASKSYLIEPLVAKHVASLSSSLTSLALPSALSAQLKVYIDEQVACGVAKALAQGVPPPPPLPSLSSPLDTGSFIVHPPPPSSGPRTPRCTSPAAAGAIEMRLNDIEARLALVSSAMSRRDTSVASTVSVTVAEAVKYASATNQASLSHLEGQFGSRLQSVRSELAELAASTTAGPTPSALDLVRGEWLTSLEEVKSSTSAQTANVLATLKFHASTVRENLEAQSTLLKTHVAKSQQETNDRLHGMEVAVNEASKRVAFLSSALDGRLGGLSSELQRQLGEVDSRVSASLQQLQRDSEGLAALTHTQYEALTQAVEPALQQLDRLQAAVAQQTEKGAALEAVCDARIGEVAKRTLETKAVVEGRVQALDASLHSKLDSTFSRLASEVRTALSHSQEVVAAKLLGLETQLGHVNEACSNHATSTNVRAAADRKAVDDVCHQLACAVEDACELSRRNSEDCQSALVRALARLDTEVTSRNAALEVRLRGLTDQLNALTPTPTSHSHSHRRSGSGGGVSANGGGGGGHSEAEGELFTQAAEKTSQLAHSVSLLTSELDRLRHTVILDSESSEGRFSDVQRTLDRKGEELSGAIASQAAHTAKTLDMFKAGLENGASETREKLFAALREGEERMTAILSSHIRGQEERGSVQHSRMDKLGDEVAGVRSRVEETAVECANLRAAIARSNEGVTALERVVSSKANSEGVNQAQERVVAELKSSQKQLTQLTSEVAALREAVSNCERAAAGGSASVEEQLQAAQHLQQAALSTAIAQLTSDVQSRVSDLTAHVDAEVDKVGALEGRFASQFSAQQATLEAHTNQSTVVHNELAAQLAATRSELSDNIGQVACSAADGLADVADKIAAVEESSKAQLPLLQRVTSQVKALEDVVPTLQSGVTALETRVNESSNDVTATLKELQAEQAHTGTYTRGVASRVEELKGEVATRVEELRNVSTRVQELRGEVASLVQERVDTCVRQEISALVADALPFHISEPIARAVDAAVTASSLGEHIQTGIRAALPGMVAGFLPVALERFASRAGISSGTGSGGGCVYTPLSPSTVASIVSGVAVPVAALTLSPTPTATTASRSSGVAVGATATSPAGPNLNFDGASIPTALPFAAASSPGYRSTVLATGTTTSAGVPVHTSSSTAGTGTGLGAGIHVVSPLGRTAPSAPQAVDAGELKALLQRHQSLSRVNSRVTMPTPAELFGHKSLASPSTELQARSITPLLKGGSTPVSASVEPGDTGTLNGVAASSGVNGQVGRVSSPLRSHILTATSPAGPARSSSVGGHGYLTSPLGRTAGPVSPAAFASGGGGGSVTPVSPDNTSWNGVRLRSLSQRVLDAHLGVSGSSSIGVSHAVPPITAVPEERLEGGGGGDEDSGDEHHVGNHHHDAIVALEGDDSNMDAVIS